ncbi:MAG: hypothetical protein B7Z63_04860, partial [Ignavibacteriae bacterium 37-53-5]
ILAVFDCNGIIFAGTTLHNVLYSTDHGSTWMESDSGLISNSVQLAFGSSSDSTIFAGTDLGLFTSSDTGKSWVQTDRKDVQGEVRAIAVNGECVVVGSDSGVFFSNDDGKTWEKRVHGLKSLFVSSLVWDNDILLCGTGAWIYSSADSGKDWTLADGGPDVSYINAIGTHNGVVFAAVRQGRTYLSTDNGGRWDQTKGIPDSASVTSFAKSPSHFYACTDHGLFKLNDTDTTWVNVDTTGVLTGSYSLTAWSDTTLFVESGGKLYRSKDGGSNWAESDSGLAGNLILASMAIDDTELFVGTSDGLYCSSDSGILWQELAVVDSSQQPAVGSIFIINRDTILLSGSNTFYSSDGGTTWACVSNYQLHNFVEAVNYILALRYGIETPYLSTDYGSNWRDISYNLSNGVDPTCLISASSYIFLGSRFSGVWRLPISYIDSVLSGIRGLKSPDRFQLGQNYPNPFNPTTTIQYEIPRQERVTLEIYDVLGQKVSTLVDGMLQPGQYAAM